MEEKAKIDVLNFVILSSNLSIAKEINNSLRQHERELKDTALRVFPYGNVERVAERLNNSTCDVLLVDEAYINDFYGEWIKELKNLITNEENKDIPMILMSTEIDPKKAEKALMSGFSDIILKPIDPSMALQKIDLQMKRMRFLSENQMVNIECSEDITVSLKERISMVSEYGVTIISNRPYFVGDVVNLDSGIFGGNSVTAQCQRSSKGKDPGQYESFFVFVGTDPKFCTNIRRWIRSDYVKKK